MSEYYERSSIMMQNYYFYIYPDINGNYEVHTENCYYLPSELNRQYIGRYSSCQAAIIAAQIAYPDKKFDGCYHCCRECHKVDYAKLSIVRPMQSSRLCKVRFNIPYK